MLITVDIAKVFVNFLKAIDLLLLVDAQKLNLFFFREYSEKGCGIQVILK